MGPEAIKKLTDANMKVEFAKRGVTSASIEANEPARRRAFELESRYEAEGLDTAARKEVGEALDKRVSALKRGLWDQDDHPQVRAAFAYPHKETKVITAEGFVPLHITLYHEEGPDADPHNHPEGHITVTDEHEYWELNHDDRPGVADWIEHPRMHAKLEDDVNTLELLYDALGLDIPE